MTLHNISWCTSVNKSGPFPCASNAHRNCIRFTKLCKTSILLDSRRRSMLRDVDGNCLLRIVLIRLPTYLWYSFMTATSGCFVESRILFLWLQNNLEAPVCLSTDRSLLISLAWSFSRYRIPNAPLSLFSLTSSILFCRCRLYSKPAIDWRNCSNIIRWLHPKPIEGSKDIRLST